MDQIQLTKKNKNANGLRGLAALLVAVHHFVGAFLPVLLHKNYPTSFAAAIHPGILVSIFSSPAMTLFYNGSFPVAIFFVLSGYVLTKPYFNNNNDPFVLHKRLWGRYLRLNIPIASAILLSYVVYLCHGYYNIPASAISGSNIWLHLFFQPGLSFGTALKDMLWRSLLLGDGNFNPVFWTLKIEFIGSIFLLLFYLAKPKGNNLISMLVIFFLVSSILTGSDMTVFLFAILLGSLLNIVTIPKKWRPIILLCGLYFGAIQHENSWYHFLDLKTWHQYICFNTIGAILITGPIINGYGARLFQSQLCQFLGKISFPLYLLHFVVLCSFSCGLYLWLPHTAIALFIIFILYLFVSIMLSVVFEKYVDQPAIRLARNFSNFLFKSK